MAVQNVYKKSDSVRVSEHDIDLSQKVKPLAFGERLRSERDRLELSQLSFAELGGVKRTTQHLYETGVRVPDLHYLERIKNSGVDLAYLVLGERLPTHEGVSISHSTLTALYRLVDEFCVTSEGVLLPLDTRLRFFQMLCAAVGHLRGEDADIDSLRAEMSRFRSA